MKACMVAYTFYETDNRVRRYAESLALRGDYVEAVALQRPGQPEYEVIRGVHVYRIQQRKIDERGPASYLIKLLAFFLRSAWFLTKSHWRSPYQLIHVHSVPDFEVFAALIPRLTGAKVILDIHDIVPEFYASKFKVSEGSLAFRALLAAERLSIAFSHHVIIANDLWHKKLVRRSTAPEKCTAMINFPDLSIFSRHELPRLETNEFVLCYPGTLNRHQGLDIAVRAMAIVKDRIPQARLLIIGDGPERENLKQMIRDRKLEDRVELRGLVPIEQVAKIMSQVDLGVVPKRSDSFGNEAFSTKIMEFMAMGVPVLASETRIDRYYFSDEIVQFFKSGDEQDLASRIVELAENTERRESLRANAQTFIDSNSWDVKKHIYFERIEDLIGEAKWNDSGVASVANDPQK